MPGPATVRAQPQVSLILLITVKNDLFLLYIIIFEFILINNINKSLNFINNINLKFCTLQQVHRQSQSFTPQQFRALFAAYRVGMLALETLARRVHDDRPQAKYARNPPYGEDVKWLLRVSKRLGTQYLHQLCVCVINSIASPFVLHDVALEAAFYLSRNNHGLVIQDLRSALLAPLVHKCQQMLVINFFLCSKIICF